MKITCDNCGAIYRIPEEKLTKDVSRATCKKCGSKLIIRRPSDEGGDDLRFAGAQGGAGDDDSVINHEERTVIAQVPELQKFDATPPLSSGAVGSQDELRGLLGGAAAAPSTPASSGASRSVADEPKRSSQATAAKPSTPPPASRPASSAPAASPAITATTSPAPPSGQPAAAPVSAPVQAAAATPAANKANVVDIFSKPVQKPGGSSEFQQPVSKLPMALLGVALLGVLAFIDEGLWGLTRVTAAGFFVALYCILAAFLSQLDLASSGRINFVKVFLVPAVACLGILALLWTLQGSKVAFLHPELDVSIVKEYIASLPQAPEAEKASKGDLKEKIQVAMRSGRVRRPEQAGSDDAMPDLSNLSRPDATGEELPGMRDGGAGQLAVGDAPRLNTGWTPERKETRLPGSTKVASAPTSVDFDAEGIQKTIDGGRVGMCFTTSASGLTLPRRIDLSIQMNPDGSARAARIENSELQSTTLEKCMKERVTTLKFPSFEGSGPEWYTYTFIL